MPRHTIPVLGLEITIATEAESERIDEARQLVEKLYEGLKPRGGNISKEKLLTVLALSLADDYLQSNQKLRELEVKLHRLVEKIDWTSA